MDMIDTSKKRVSLIERLAKVQPTPAPQEPVLPVTHRTSA